MKLKLIPANCFPNFAHILFPTLTCFAFVVDLFLLSLPPFLLCVNRKHRSFHSKAVWEEECRKQGKTSTHISPYLNTFPTQKILSFRHKTKLSERQMRDRKNLGKKHVVSGPLVWEEEREDERKKTFFSF